MTDFIFLGFKITADGDCRHEIKRHLLLGRKAMTNLLKKLHQLCPTLCGPMDHSPSGSSVHGILQARILQWVAMLSSSRSSQPKDQTHVSCLLGIAGRFFTAEPSIILDSLFLWYGYIILYKVLSFWRIKVYYLSRISFVKPVSDP